MKSVKIVLVALVSVLMMSSTGKEGISFSDLTLKEAKVLSKKTGKLIFIDCYTDWCGPCKRMAATSFLDEAVGKVFNDKFINLKVEMEKNPIGVELAKRYRVRAYPTLLVIESEGTLIKQVVGMQSSNGLITMANSIR